MKIHASVRLDNEVYLPNNDEHAEMLAERLSDRQKIRLAEAGAISGPGSEVEGVTHLRTSPSDIDDTDGVITKAPSKKRKKKAAPKTKPVPKKEESEGQTKMPETWKSEGKDEAAE